MDVVVAGAGATGAAVAFAAAFAVAVDAAAVDAVYAAPVDDAAAAEPELTAVLALSTLSSWVNHCFSH